MHKTLKIITVSLVLLMAMAAILPSKNNYYEEVIGLVMTQHGLQADGLAMQSGSYQNLMLFKTVQMDLISSDHEIIYHAVAQKRPFTDWYLTGFKRRSALD